MQTRGEEGGDSTSFETMFSTNPLPGRLRRCRRRDGRHEQRRARAGREVGRTPGGGQRSTELRRRRPRHVCHMQPPRPTDRKYPTDLPMFADRSVAPLPAPQRRHPRAPRAHIGHRNPVQHPSGIAVFPRLQQQRPRRHVGAVKHDVYGRRRRRRRRREAGHSRRRRDHTPLVQESEENHPREYGPV